MPQDKNALPTKQEKPAVKDVKKEKVAPADEASSDKEKELEEGLEESFPGSDAPSSTRRASKE